MRTPMPTERRRALCRAGTDSRPDCSTATTIAQHPSVFPLRSCWVCRPRTSPGSRPRWRRVRPDTCCCVLASRRPVDASTAAGRVFDAGIRCSAVPDRLPPNADRRPSIGQDGRPLPWRWRRRHAGDRTLIGRLRRCPWTMTIRCRRLSRVVNSASWTRRRRRRVHSGLPVHSQPLQSPESVFAHSLASAYRVAVVTCRLTSYFIAHQ